LNYFRFKAYRELLHISKTSRLIFCSQERIVFSHVSLTFLVKHRAENSKNAGTKGKKNIEKYDNIEYI